MRTSKASAGLPSNAFETSGGSGRFFAYTILFIIPFAAIFVMLLGCAFWVIGKGHRLWMPVLTAMMVASVLSCRVPVARYTLRNVWPIRCITFLAGFLSSALLFYVLYRLVERHWGASLLPGMRILFPVMSCAFGVACAGHAVLRAMYLFSETSGQWLRSYTTRKRFVAKDQVLDPAALTIGDILEFAPSPKRTPTYSLILYVDTLPEGSHFLAVKTNAHAVFFAIKAPKIKRRTVLFPVTFDQVSLIRDKFGPFRKTAIIRPAFMWMLANRKKGVTQS